MKTAETIIIKHTGARYWESWDLWKKEAVIKAMEEYRQQSYASQPMSVERNKYKYLIERKDTNEWYCINITGYYGTTYEGETFGEIPDKKNDWTNNANDALQFNSRQEAELFIKGQEYLHDVLHFDCEITEHEFISENANPSPSPITQTTTSMSVEQVEEDAINSRFGNEKFVENVCLSYNHSFGLMAEQDKQALRFECNEWMRAIKNNWKYHPTSPTVKADGRKPYNEDGTCKKCGGNQCDSDSHK